MDSRAEQRRRGGAVWRAWSAIPEEIARRLEAGGEVLEVGCGSGFGCLAVAERFPSVRVVGHDEDPAAIVRARSLARAAGLDGRVRFEATDSLHLARLSAEVIVAATAFERTGAARLLNVIRNALVPDGVCLLVRATASDEQARALAQAAGFSRVQRVPAQPHPAVYELRR